MISYISSFFKTPSSLKSYPGGDASSAKQKLETSKKYDVSPYSQPELKHSELMELERLKTDVAGKGLFDRHITKALSSYEGHKVPLSACEYVALRAYTLDEQDFSYRQDITQCARQTTGDWGNMTNVVCYLKSALGTLRQSSSELIGDSSASFLYQGKMNNDHILNAEHFREGEIFREAGFFSTTSNIGIAYHFMSRPFLQDNTDWLGCSFADQCYSYVPDSTLIMVKAKSGVDVSEFSERKIEKEVLFDGPEFRVVFKGYSEQGIKNISRRENLMVPDAQGAWLVLLEETTIAESEGYSDNGLIKALDLATPARNIRK